MSIARDPLAGRVRIPDYIGGVIGGVLRPRGEEGHKMEDELEDSEHGGLNELVCVLCCARSDLLYDQPAADRSMRLAHGRTRACPARENESSVRG